jgi:RNA polymerase sigma-70 factor (ECF subfamily)
MASTAGRDDAAHAVAEEARLARAAAAGDGSAFATLYQRYEGRAYNLAYRLSGSEADAAEATQDAFLKVMRRLPQLEGRELAFGSYLFTATRHACYDLIEQRRRTQPSEAIPEAAMPVGAGGGGAAPDPGDPEDDPDRKLLLESQQEEIRTANMRIPERQREALALRELEELSYDEIATIMEMNRNSVAQLISRARISLRDELRGTALASIAVASPQCERALPLIAMRDDGQLDPGGEDEAWLDAHLAGCERCRLGVEAMQEAGASYRAWAPIAVAPWLLEETMAKAAEQAGADWSEPLAAALASRGAAGTRRFARRRRLIAAAGLIGVLLGVGVATVVAGDDPAPVPEQPAEATGAAQSVPAKQSNTSSGAGHTRKAQQEQEQSQAKAAPKPEAATSAAAPAPAQPPASEPAPTTTPDPQPTRSSGGGQAGLQTSRDQATPKPKPKPPPATAPPPATPPAPPPPAEPPPSEPPPEEEPPRERTPREPPAGIPPPR